MNLGLFKIKAPWAVFTNRPKSENAELVENKIRLL